MNSRDIWNEHYQKEKSKLFYPDENLVRILSRIEHKGEALDFGAGSGRHSLLLQQLGYKVTAVDYSHNSIKYIQETFPGIQAKLINKPPYPFQDKQFSLIVSWGVLHYNTYQESKNIVLEYNRLLKQNAYLLGTIRSDNDTHLKLQDGMVGLDDLKNSRVQLYSLTKLQELLKDFADVQYAYMERTPLGKLEDRICHWIFLAKN